MSFAKVIYLYAFNLSTLPTDPCPLSLTVDITLGTRVQGDSIQYDYITYERKDYFTYNSKIYGCVCNIKKCIRKCCDQNEIMENKVCIKGKSEIDNLNIYDETELIPNLKLEDYYIIVGKNCTEQHYPIKPDSNEALYVQQNGSLYYADWNMLYHLEEYCIDTFMNETSALLCEFSDTRNEQMQRGLTGTGMIISMPFLLITFVVYLLLPERNLHRRALMSYVATLLGAYITLVTIQLYTGQFPEVACHVMGYLIIFFFLVSFFWMNVMCIDMWLAFSGMRAFLSKKEAEKKRFIIYCIYAWGMPTLHTFVVFLINTLADLSSSFHPEIGKRRCFLGEELPTFYYFYLPMAILIGINIVLFVLTTVRIQRIKKETSMLKQSESKRHSYEDDKQKFKLYLKLMFAMGVNWIMELVSWIVEWKVKDAPIYVWYLTDFTNAMYGVLIFIIFVFKWKIWRSLKKRYYVWIGKPHLANSMTASSARGTRTSNYSTTETGVTTDYRINDIRNGRPEEIALTRT